MGFDRLADGRAGGLQRTQVACIDTPEQGLDLSSDPCFGDEAPVALGGEGEAGRHAHPGADQFAERGTLAPDQGN